MSTEPAVATYVIAEPFERTVKTLREALARSGLNVAAELDVSVRIKHELNLGFTPCRILLVDSPYLLLEAVTVDCAAAVLFPLHIVVSGRGPHTHVHWMHPAAVDGLRLPPGGAVPLAKLLSLVSHTLERIAIRRDHLPSKVLI